MTPAVCPACHRIVRRLLDLRAVELIIVEPDPWIDDGGREHWIVHPCSIEPEDLQPAEQYL